MDPSLLISQFLAWSQDVIQAWGYLGLFVISLVSSASIIFPAPAFLIVFAAGAVLNPWLIGISAGIGSAIGELTAYAIGIGGRKVAMEKHRKWLDRAELWFERHGAFPIIILFAATPLPHDVVGILCGVLRYDVKKFLLATAIGKIIISFILAWAGFYGLNWLLGYFTVG